MAGALRGASILLSLSRSRSVLLVLEKLSMVPTSRVADDSAILQKCPFVILLLLRREPDYRGLRDRHYLLALKNYLAVPASVTKETQPPAVEARV